jgi:pentatricopeptide repeat protein
MSVVPHERCLIPVIVVLGIISAYFCQAWLTYLFDELLMIASCVSCYLLVIAKDNAAGRFMRRARTAHAQGKHAHKQHEVDREVATLKKLVPESSPTLAERSVATPANACGALVEEDAKKNQLVNKIVAAAKADKLSECEPMMRRLLAMASPTPSYVYGVLISAYAKAGKEREADNWLKALIDAGHGAPKITCFNVLISAYAKKNNLAQAERCINWMSHIGVSPDVVSYNAVISACIGMRDAAKAEEWFERMQSAGIEPNAVSFSSLINACSKADDKLRTERWLDRVPEDVFVNPTAVCFGTLIGASAKVGRIDVAERWLERFIQSGLEPNVISFNILIAACARTGDVQKVETWYNRMQELGVEPDSVTHNGILAAFAQKRDVQRAEEWLCHMDKQGIANVVSYCSVIHICAKTNDVSRAEKWLERLTTESNADDATLPIVRCYNAVIHALSREGRHGAAASWVDKMMAQGYRPTAETFSTSIARLSKRGHAEVAEQWLKRMLNAGVQPDGKTVSFVMRAHLKGKSFDAAQALMERLYPFGLTPNIHVLGKLIQHYEGIGDAEAVGKCQRSSRLLGNFKTISAAGRLSTSAPLDLSDGEED